MEIINQKLAPLPFMCYNITCYKKQKVTSLKLDLCCHDILMQFCYTCPLAGSSTHSGDKLKNTIAILLES